MTVSHRKVFYLLVHTGHLQAARNAIKRENIPDQKLPLGKAERWMPMVWMGSKGNQGTSTAHRVWFQLCSLLRAAATTVGNCSDEELYINVNPEEEGANSSEF